MKNVLTFFCTVALSFSCFAQATSYGNFYIENRELIFRTVNDTSISVDACVKFLESLSPVKINQVYDDYIIAEFEGMPVDFRRYGHKWGSTPMVVQAYDAAGKIRIDLKENKYRITLHGIKLINGTSSQFTDTDFSEFMLRNKKDAIRPVCASSNILGIYDRVFADFFKIRPTSMTKDNW